MRFLRSPRLALWLVVTLTAYSFLATFIPQTGLTDPDTMAWMARHPGWTDVLRPLGLFAAFGTPVFYLLIALLTASTAACSWARSRASVQLWKSQGMVTDSIIRRLQERPQFVIPADEGSVERCASALKSVGLRVRKGPRLVVGTAGRAGLLGSPAFHWALVAFFIVVSAGQLTRSDGQMGIPVGGSRSEVAASYGRLATGAFFTRHSGLTLSVPSVEKRNIVEGIDREPAPRVVLSDGTRVLRDQLVYPNNPLRYRGLIVHRGPFGFTVPISVESTTGERMGSSDLFIDIDAAVPSGTSPTTFDLQDQGRGGEVTLTLVASRGPQNRVALQPQPTMQVRLESDSIPVPATATAPGTVALPDGSTLKLGPVGIYARVVVVNDWSVWWIYALLGIATIGLSMVMLAPHRVVRVLLVDTGNGARLHAIVSNSRRDPLFSARVEDALKQASDVALNTEAEGC